MFIIYKVCIIVLIIYIYFLMGSLWMVFVIVSCGNIEFDLWIGIS